MKEKIKIAGLEVKGLVMNASGAKDTTWEELEALAKSETGMIVMKSCTPLPRKGNPEPRLAETKMGMIQSMGWPNLGFEKYVEFAKRLKGICDKPIVASVAGFCDEDYVKIVEAFSKSEVDLIEISVSCPNIEGHPQLGYDPEKCDELLGKLVGIGEKPLGLKLPAYLDRAQQEKMAEVIKKHKIAFVTAINSLGNCLIIDPEKETPIIKPRGGMGGLCGSYLKPVALGNVRGWWELLKDEGVAILGVGGVENGNDVVEFLLAGADAVQVATTLEKEGVGCFERINGEVEKVLERKGKKSGTEMKGKLKELS